jgi:hypothetical protein
MKNTKTINVKCTFVIPVEVPTDVEGYDEFFDIEDNHCPGTGLVGVAIDLHIKKHTEEGFCWACALNGKCEIV